MTLQFTSGVVVVMQWDGESGEIIMFIFYVLILKKCKYHTFYSFIYIIEETLVLFFAKSKMKQVQILKTTHD